MLKAWFYNLFYVGLLVAFLPQLLYRALRHGKYRHGFKQKYLGRIPRRRNVLAAARSRKREVESAAKIIWFHAVSVGEINLLRPLLNLIADTQPDWICVISTTSLTGMELAQKLYGQTHTVFYCPLDFSWAVHKAMRRLKPDLLVLVEQELWPNLIDAAKRHGAKVAIINGRFGEKGYKNYLWIRWLVEPMLRQLDAIAAQSETYAGWFRRLGASTDAIQVIGSMKFDGARFDRDNAETRRFRRLAGIADDDVIFLAGSIQAPEEALALECFENLHADFPQLRLIIVPRHPEHFDEVAAILDAKAVLWERRSSLSETADETDNSPSEELEGGSSRKAVRPRILLVDTVGELGGWWGTASLAFVGGSMGSRGGQNMIEPAAYGAAVCFGPNTKNFRDIVDLMLRGEAAQIVHDQHEMEQFLRECLSNPEFSRRLGKNAQELVQKQLGATRRTLDMLEELFRADTL